MLSYSKVYNETVNNRLCKNSYILTITKLQKFDVSFTSLIVILRTVSNVCYEGVEQSKLPQGNTLNNMVYVSLITIKKVNLIWLF